MNLEQRTAALLDLVEQYKSRRCAEMLEPARAEASDVVRSAISEARRRVSTAIAEDRKRRATEVGAVEAALATERRLSVQSHTVQLLGNAWSELRARLTARWLSSDSRQRWTEAYLRRALEAVPHDAAGWRVEYHAAWTEAERAKHSRWLHDGGVDPVCFVEDARITAGFRVVCGHNVLDATLDGLLADRAQLEGRLLHHLGEEVCA
jgi:hypothetical protein